MEVLKRLWQRVQGEFELADRRLPEVIIVIQIIATHWDRGFG